MTRVNDQKSIGRDDDSDTKKSTKAKGGSNPKSAKDTSGLTRGGPENTEPDGE